MDLADELTELVAMLLTVEPADIAHDTSFTDLELDSLSRLELVAHVEQRLGMLIPEDEIPELDTIAEVVKFAEAFAAS